MSAGPHAIKKISVIGLGRLGACIAAAFASRGIQVIGYDIDRRKTEAIRNRLAPVEEPHVQATMEQAGSRLTATDEIEQAVLETDASFFVPSTPTLPDGSFSNEFLTAAVESAAAALRGNQRRRHLFIVSATVTPGTCDAVVKPLLEKMLGACGRDFGLCYNPQFVALGNVMQGLLQPDLVLIGEADESSGELLSQAYETLTANSPPIVRMSTINAELAKIALNCAVTMKISFVNQLSGVCAQIPGSDPQVILKAIGKDRRIGADYLRPGLGYGGPCFPRDNRLFQYVAQSVGAEAALSRATDTINEDLNRRLLETVLRNCPRGASVGILGLAYKPSTPVIDQSPGMWLCERLADSGRRVFAHDYLANANARSTLAPSHQGRIQICNDPAEILQKGCRAIVIACPWPQYEVFFRPNIEELCGKKTAIIDPWRLLSALAAEFKSGRYITNLSATAAVAPERAAHA